MDVAKGDPTKLEARSPQPGRSGFLNSAAAPSGPAPAGRGEAPAGKGIAAPLGPKSLSGIFAGMGLSLGAERLGLVQDRVMAALTLIASRAPLSAAPVPERGGASLQERAAATYRRASSAAEPGHGSRARSLAVLEGLFAGAGLDLGAEGLAALSSDVEGGGSGGQAAGQDAPGGRRENAGSEGTGGEPSSGGDGRGRPSLAAPGAPAEEGRGEAELDAFAAMAKDFFRSSGDGPNDWQAFNERQRGLDPGWSLVPFGFTAGNVEFSGYFRVLFNKRERAVLSLGADFRSNGHFYSFTLRGSELSLEGPDLRRGADLRAVEGLAASLEAAGLRLTCPESPETERGEGEWA